MKAKVGSKSGFTLVEIMIVVSIIGTLAVIAIPNLIRARGTAQQKACINNMRQIDSAKQQWALENRKGDTATPTTSDCVNYIRNNSFPTCPSSGTYSVNAMNADPTCSQADSAEPHVY